MKNDNGDFGIIQLLLGMNYLTYYLKKSIPWVFMVHS
jgi:hypothetical protein